MMTYSRMSIIKGSSRTIRQVTMQKQAVLNLLGLARRASRLVTGDNLVLGSDSLA